MTGTYCEENATWINPNLESLPTVSNSPCLVVSVNHDQLVRKTILLAKPCLLGNILLNLLLQETDRRRTI